MGDDAITPTSGQIPFAAGQASVVCIPIPGTSGLCVEFKARGWTPKAGSTSTLFFHDSLGKRHLRLDYGFNEKTKTINYHWNQKGTYAQQILTGVRRCFRHDARTFGSPSLWMAHAI